MKKMLLVLGTCFLALSLLAQEKRYMLGDQRVEPPKFVWEQLDTEKMDMGRSPISYFMEDELTYPDLVYDIPPEGIVGVEFTVNEDGKLSNFNVTNPVAHELDQAVITCLKKTNGMWIPGKVNERPFPMENRVFVKFDVPGNESFDELGKDFYLYALKKYYKGCNIQNDLLLPAEKKEKRSARMFNNSLYYLAKASLYCPLESSIIFWQANNYEKLGKHQEKREKLSQFEELVYMQLNDQIELYKNNMAVIEK